jgi:polyisoprenoid-binding protein YceI
MKNKAMNAQVSLLALALALASSAVAAPQSFDFKDAKGVNNAQFKLDAPLEAITGHANGISGTVSFDPANPGETKGKIVVASESLSVPNSMMKGHLHSDKWLDVAKHPEITFETKALKNVKTTGDVTTADAVGTFTMKGISKEITIPVKLTYLKDKLSARLPSMKGDLLVVRSNFSIKRSDFNIQPGQSEDKVSDEIELTLAVAGASPK